jgi:hypothetical protein
MLKLALAFLLSVPAFGSTASFGLKLVEGNENQDTVVGLSLAQPLFLGIGYSTWLGMGTLDNEIKWAENSHALDFSLPMDAKITLAAKLQENIVTEEFSHEYSLGVKIKLW